MPFKGALGIVLKAQDTVPQRAPRSELAPQETKLTRCPADLAPHFVFHHGVSSRQGGTAILSRAAHPIPYEGGRDVGQVGGGMGLLDVRPQVVDAEAILVLELHGAQGAPQKRGRRVRAAARARVDRGRGATAGGGSRGRGGSRFRPSFRLRTGPGPQQIDVPGEVGPPNVRLQVAVARAAVAVAELDPADRAAHAGVVGASIGRPGRWAGRGRRTNKLVLCAVWVAANPGKALSLRPAGVLAPPLATGIGQDVASSDGLPNWLLILLHQHGEGGSNCGLLFRGPQAEGVTYGCLWGVRRSVGHLGCAWCVGRRHPGALDMPGVHDRQRRQRAPAAPSLPSRRRPLPGSRPTRSRSYPVAVWSNFEARQATEEAAAV